MKPKSPPPNPPKAHPLFPAATPGEEPPEVEWIHVTRFSADGGPKYHKRRFLAEELTELQQIGEAFGGGTYELIAYAGGAISARRRYRLDGRQLPMNPEEPADTGEPPITPPPPITGTDPMMAQMFQLLIATMQASANQNAQLIQLLLQQGQAQTQAHVQTMAQLYERSQARDAEIFKLIAEMSKGGGGDGGVDALIRGLEIGKEIGSGGESDEDDTLGKVAEIAQSIVGGVALAKGQSMPPSPEVPS